MSNIINQYIKRSILLNIFSIFIILISLSNIMRIIDELRNFEKKDYSIYEICFCSFLNLPKDFDLFLPISILLGGLLGLSILETRNELIIMQISGFSKLQISISVIKASIFILLFNMISNEWLLPYTQKIINIYRNNNQYNTYLFSEKNKNLWLIDKNNYISIEYILTTQHLTGINLYCFTKDKKLKKILYIEQAIYTNNHWSLHNIIELSFFNQSYIITKKKSDQQWNTTLTPNILSMITIHPRILSISKLIYCIKYFNNIGQNSNYYQLIFWNKILSPVIGIMMLITALSCSFGPFYKKKINIRLFFGSIIGFLFYIFHQLSGILSIIYNITPLIGAITPIVIILIINIIILWKHSQHNKLIKLF